jgi:hypothetical protein
MSMTLAEQYRSIHAAQPGYGSSCFWAKDILALVGRRGERVKSVLDYGCGKGAMVRCLARTLRSENVAGYDFAIQEYEKEPQPADLVTLIDVCEHFEVGTVKPNLAKVRDLARDAVFVVVSCRKATQMLPDGRNAHLSVHPPEWWADRMREVWGQEWELRQLAWHERNRHVVFEITRRHAHSSTDVLAAGEMEKE